MTNKKMKASVAPEVFQQATALANAIGEDMLARLEWVTLQPKVIVDVGCGVGYGALRLQARYPAACIVSLDMDYPILQYAAQQAKKSGVEGPHFIYADAGTLPFADQSVDLLFANLALSWAENTGNVLREWRRVLRPEGLLMFTGLGPDTLQAWRAELGNYMIPNCLDMHEFGDLLIQARFSDPVLDVEYYTLTYPDHKALYAELQACGFLVADSDLTALQKAVADAPCSGRLATQYEVVYGHAWGPAVQVDQVADEFGIVRIPLAHLRRKA